MLEASHVKHVARYIDDTLYNRVTADAYTDIPHDIVVSRSAVVFVYPYNGSIEVYTNETLVISLSHTVRALIDISEPVDIEQHLRETVANRGRGAYNSH
jgi:hypothetical protein